MWQESSFGLWLPAKSPAGNLSSANSLSSKFPELVVIAGPNGAGKSTFYASQLALANLIFVNADVLAAKFELSPYEAAALAQSLREALLAEKESFVFETVFSDREGSKLSFLEQAVELGYRVTLCFIGLDSAETSQQRVAMRVTQGGHDVPDEKLEARYPRSLENLRQAIRRLPEVRVYDNSDLRTPYRHLATYQTGKQVHVKPPLPAWFSTLAAEPETEGP